MGNGEIIDFAVCLFDVLEFLKVYNVFCCSVNQIQNQNQSGYLCFIIYI